MYKKGYCARCRKTYIFDSNDNISWCPVCNKYLTLVGLDEDPKKMFAMAKKVEYLKIHPQKSANIR